MLSEEAFVLVLGLIATGLLVLGILEAFLPTRRPRPWPPRRRSAGPPVAADGARLRGPLGLGHQARGEADAVGRLTAEAIRRLQEGREDEVFGALDRAEAALAAIADDAVPPERRQELERRLWWGFTRLGVARVEAGRLEEAVEPLMRALAFRAVGPDRQQETRGPLARALRGVVEAQRAEAQRLMTAGDREGARRFAERLRALLAAATERGLTRDELAGALEATDGLLDRLAQVP